MQISEKAKKQLTDAGVGLVYLFGSRAQQTTHPMSDYDIGVVFINKNKPPSSLEMYHQLYEIFTDELLPNPDTKLDISFLQQANAALRMSAVRHGIVLFEINSRFRADFEECALYAYDDYYSIRKEFEEATVRAFAK